MKTVTRSRVEIIRHARPNAYIDHRDGQEVLVIPEYDIDTDRTSEILMKVIDDPKTGPKPYKPGDVHYTRDGQPFKIVGILKALQNRGRSGTPKPKVRKGPISE